MYVHGFQTRAFASYLDARDDVCMYQPPNTPTHNLSVQSPSLLNMVRLFAEAIVRAAVAVPIPQCVRGPGLNHALRHTLGVSLKVSPLPHAPAFTSQRAEKEERNSQSW